jgi:arabinogalactan endo-1,4-beta-galactosidase
VPGGHGAGLFHSEPEWLPGVGWEPGAGSPNDNVTLLDFQGLALPSVTISQSPVRTAAASS